MNKILKTPIQSEDVEQLKIGDIVFLDGYLVTCRDMAHRRLIDMGMKLPVDLEGLAILHAGQTTPGQVSYEDLGQAAFSGRICLSSSTLADNRLLLANLIDSNGNKVTERLVRLWVRNLARPPFSSQAELRAALRAGDCDYGIVSNAHTVFGNWDRTPPPHAYAATAVGIGRHAVNADGAQTLADWLLRNRSVRIPSYEALPHAGIAGWRDEEASLLAERAGYR